MPQDDYDEVRFPVPRAALLEAYSHIPLRDLPRGIRNNNPGNIDYNERTLWIGLANPPVEMGVPHPRFARFIHPEYGIRAICRLLVTYQVKHRLYTVSAILNRYAPARENDTPAYVTSVAQKLGVDPVQTSISVRDRGVMHPLILAIIAHENGMQPYRDEVIENALDMADIAPEPPASVLAASRSSPSWRDRLLSLFGRKK